MLEELLARSLLPDTLSLWRARFYYLHNTLLTSNVEQLQDNSLDLYSQGIQRISSKHQKARAVAALLRAEFSYCALAFHKYQLAEEQVA